VRVLIAVYVIALALFILTEYVLARLTVDCVSVAVYALIGAKLFEILPQTYIFC
jgi:hypothetical protein